MSVFSILAVSFLMNVVAALFFVSAVALILLILVQKGRGGGLSAAFTGGAASGIMGSKTGDFLTWVTIVLAGLFLIFAVLLAKYYRPSLSEIQGEPTTTQSQPAQSGQ